MPGFPVPLRFATRAVRAAPPAASVSRPLTPPITLASVYAFESLEQVDAVWEGRQPGYVYGRSAPPTTRCSRPRWPTWKEPRPPW